jgi:hypothetical protein
MPTKFKAFLFVLAASVSLDAFAQAPDPASLIAAQREAMKAFAAMDGVWRGPAWSLQPNGEKRNLTQTERIGPFLDGSVKVIEGRGYTEDGTVGFNALGVVSYDPAKKAFTIRSWAMGRGGEFAFTPLPDGYAWEIPAGPGATIKYRATIKDNTLVEVGDRHTAERPPLRIFEMNLKRVGDSDWPAANPVPQR